MNIKVINISRNQLPEYATPQSAGMDCRANLLTSVTLLPMERYLVPLGIKIELPQGYECQVRPRSGLAVKHGITVLNSPGTVDADYRGEIHALVINLSNEAFIIEPNMRIAQIVFAKHEKAEFQVVEALSETERGEGGHGHTGIN